MARTISEVVNFLNGQVGQSVNVKCGSLKGQCVSLVKSLLEFVGAPNPYAARGNAKDIPANYVNQGIAKLGNGTLEVRANRSLGNGYGHVWIVAQGQNWEQNGAKKLITTKNTAGYPATNIINLDQYLVAPAANPSGTFKLQVSGAPNGGLNVRSAPNGSAPICGSKWLKNGDVFESVGLVTGQTVAGCNIWAKSTKGNYVWAKYLKRV